MWDFAVSSKTWCSVFVEKRTFSRHRSPVMNEQIKATCYVGPAGWSHRDRLNVSSSKRWIIFNVEVLSPTRTFKQRLWKWHMELIFATSFNPPYSLRRSSRCLPSTFFVCSSFIINYLCFGSRLCAKSSTVPAVVSDSLPECVDRNACERLILGSSVEEPRSGSRNERLIRYSFTLYCSIVVGLVCSKLFWQTP